MRTIYYFLSVLIIAGVLTSCSKGNTGPTGSAGATGATGPQGPKGDTGATGNANVISQQFSVPAWTYNSPQWYVNLTVSALTSKVLTSGAVEVYLSPNAGTNWYAMPYMVYGSVADYIGGFVTGLNSVQVTWIYNGVGSGSDPNAYYSTSACLINIVCIAPAMIQSHPNVNWGDPAEVALIPEVKTQLNKLKNR